MPTVTAAPISPLGRLKAKLGPLPPPTARDRARWRRIAADRSPVTVTDEAPDPGRPVPGIVECAEHPSFPIDGRTAAWFKAHGGVRAVRQALRAYMQAHAIDRPKPRGARSTTLSKGRRR